MASREVLLLASGDQRLSANQNCWAAQRDMEQRLAAAVSAQGYALLRAHPFKEAEGHGFIASQREGIEVFRTIRRTRRSSSPRRCGSIRIMCSLG